MMKAGVGRARLIWVMCGSLLGLTGGVALATPQTPFMQTGAVTSQPIGHYEFCKRYAAECAVRLPTPGAVDLTTGEWNLVNRINSEVNRDVRPVSDQDQYGRQEVWAYPQGAGDCEDYALEKRRKLLKAGVPAGDLLITVVRQPGGEGHAVLTLRTNRGDFVLDNLEEQVRLWSATPYHYLKRQSSYDSGRWVTIENCKDDVLVSAIPK